MLTPKRTRSVEQRLGDTPIHHITPYFTYGWNAGWTERGGVGLVVGWLKAKGARDIDIDLVLENARAAHASKHLANAAKVRWCKGVAELYQRERALTSQPVSTPSV